MGGHDPSPGIWYSGVGSKLEIRVNGSRLEGSSYSTEGQAENTSWWAALILVQTDRIVFVVLCMVGQSPYPK